ncbi:TRAF3-interacting JNK-activating modulator isoform X1 [Chiloscyllium plagiosum]|uniref:TRAF3-interacting JNK-activating modulator isoform X1 n=1 Tax=Chiloscyllium plagiosum TaxID=36176 RepID=UPI001CB87975|nr:TRAF3-interacting JNK-activating modulator isoform X1 [Chiloscyllium plagiosum]
MTSDTTSLRIMGSSPKRGLSPGGSGSSKKRRLFAESYDEKLERRHENHLTRFGRNNITTCRSSPRERNVEQNSRQVQFLKRRNLTIDEEEIKKNPAKASHHRAERTTAAATSTAFAASVLEVGLKLPPQNLTAVSQTSPQFVSCSNDTPLSKEPTHWGAKDSNFHFCASVPPQHHDSTIKRISKRDKATQMPSGIPGEIGELIRKEASQQTECGVAVLDKEIQQLSEYLKEALHRELMLKQKLTILQQLLATVLQAAEKSWKVQLDDDSMRCKLQSLENQLHTWTQNYSRDSLEESMAEMQQQKLKYELVAKESLQKAIKEKTAAEQTLVNVQRSLSVAEKECSHWKESYNRARADCAELTTRHSETTDQLHILQTKLQRVESDDVLLRNLQTKLHNVQSETQKLLDKIDALREENEVQQEQLLRSKANLQNAEEQKQIMASTITSLQELLQKKTIQATEHEKVMQQNDLLSARSEHQHQALQLEVNKLSNQLEKQSALLHAKEEECIELHSKLTIMQNEHRAFLKNMQHPQTKSKSFQKKPTQRRCCRCVAFLLMAATTAGLAVLWANLDNIPF